MDAITSVPFALPRGYLDDSGQLHREGSMRPAIALDEIEAVGHPQVQNNEAYLPVVLLSRVVTRLGDLPSITPRILERLYAADLAYLEDLYLRLNGHETLTVGAVCPCCSTHFSLQVAPLAYSET